MVASALQTLTRWGSLPPARFRDLNADSINQPFSSRAQQYDVNEAYYANNAYDTWNSVIRELCLPANLYRHTRGIYNPFRRAVDWYPGAIYPGEFTDDGLPMSDGTPCCVPFEPTTDALLRQAGMITLGWGNWSADRYVYTSMLPMLGEAFGEIETDYARGKSYPRLHHPRHVTDIAWNATGDVVLYRLDIPTQDRETGERYVWGKIVTKDEIITLKDGKPFAYDERDAEGENPFGFVPGVWVQFRNRGGQHGQSLMDGVRAKVDRLNASASSIHDYIGKFAAQGIVIKTNKPIGELKVLGQNGASATMDDYDAGQTEIRYLKAPFETEFDRLIQDLGLDDAVEHVQGLIQEIEADLPEANLDERVRALSPPPSGRALRMMFGDLGKRHAEALGNADAGLRKFIQMGITVQAHLTRTGAFGFSADLTEEQRVFLNFDLRSFQRQELAVNFVPRPLFADTPNEKVETAKAREGIRTSTGLREVGYAETELAGLLVERQRANDAERVVAFSNAGWPLAAIAREIGRTPDEITLLMNDDEAQAERGRQAFDAGEETLTNPLALTGALAGE